MIDKRIKEIEKLQNESLINDIKTLIGYAKLNDKYFNPDKYMLVIGSHRMTSLTGEQLFACQMGKFFDMRVSIDRVNKDACKLYREV